jgi:hypothetical protein
VGFSERETPSNRMSGDNWFAAGGSGAACVPVRVTVGTSRMGRGCEPGLGDVRQRFPRSVRGGGQSRVGEGELVSVGEGRGHGDLNAAHVDPHQ